MYLCWNRTNEIEEDEHHIGKAIILKIYDVIQTWSVVDFFGLGLYHTTVEVYDKEYVFGFCETSPEGIKSYQAGYLDTLELPYQFKESMVIGYTMYSNAQVEEIIAYLQTNYTSSSYDLITHNCNHFTQDFVKLLCNRDIPKYVNRLATLVSSSNFLHKIARSIVDSREDMVHNV